MMWRQGILGPNRALTFRLTFRASLIYRLRSQRLSSVAPARAGSCEGTREQGGETGRPALTVVGGRATGVTRRDSVARQRGAHRAEVAAADRNHAAAGEPQHRALVLPGPTLDV